MIVGEGHTVFVWRPYDKYLEGCNGKSGCPYGMDWAEWWLWGVYKVRDLRPK